MATLEAVTVELQNLNGTSDIQLEAMFEQNDAISALSTNIDATNVILGDILGVMKDFIRAVPEEISKGYDALLSFQERQAILDAREEKGEDSPSKSKPNKPESNDGFFKSNFNKGMEKNFGFMDAIKDNIAEVIVVAGTLAAISKKTFGGIVKSLKFLGRMVLGLGKVLLSGIKILATVLRGVFAAISLPFALITAALVGLALAVHGFVTDFQGEEGTFTDKLLAGLGGFLKGFMKLLTVPLDLLKDAISWVAGALGFEEFEKMLDGFSFTEGFAELVDIAVDFVQSIKDWLVNKVEGAISGIKSFFGFGGDEETPEKLSGSERQLLEEVQAAREDGVQRMVAQGYTEEEARAQAEKGSFDPVKTRSASRKISSDEISERLAEDANARVIEDAKTPQGASSVKEKKYRYDVLDPVTGEVIDSAGTPEAANKIAMETGGMLANPVEIKPMATPPASELNGIDVKPAAPTKVSRKRGMNLGTTDLSVKEGGKRGMDLGTTKVSRESQAPIINAVGPQPSVAVISDSPSVSSSVSTSNDRVVMSEVMSVEQNKLDENRAVSNSVSGGNMVVAPTNNTSVVNNQTINSGPMPSAMDKSDRTDRRGAFRGRVI